MRKIAGVLALFGLIVGLGWVALKPKSEAQILLSNATAAPLAAQPNQLAVFVTMENVGPPDQLMSASATHAQDATFSENHGLLALPANSRTSLAADGIFLTLNGIGGDLADGRTFPISLSFEKAGTITTRARLVAPKVSGKAADVGLFGIGDICQVGDGEPAPRIAISANETEDGWQIDVLSDDFEFTPNLVDGPHVPGTGHGHIYLNGLKLGRLFSPTTKIGHLPPGQHEIRITLSTNDHRAYVIGDKPVTASIRIHSD
ncbi:MAG: copper chaperone PCu(A)C [Shimia sp.]|uniref:copper chaperone PCu(A)C n=1 Tax=Shimia sp. TaxID=1954381 RepID=UPI003B8EA730